MRTSFDFFSTPYSEIPTPGDQTANDSRRDLKDQRFVINLKNVLQIALEELGYVICRVQKLFLSCSIDQENKMATQKHSSKRRLWLTTAFLSGVAVILAACSASETLPAPAAPAPIVECPTVSIPTPVSFDDLWNSSAHADEKNGKAGAFTHWDTTNPQEIPATCAQCHSRTGFLDFLGVDGTAPGVVDSPAKVGTRITCYVCHNEATLTLESVTFPSGKRIGRLGPEARCITCHQGRASTETVNDAIAKVVLPNDDTPSADLAFVNSHSISGATSFGTEVQGAYEYAGKSYRGRFMRGTEFFTCIRCHDQHSLQVNIEMCSECHTFDGKDAKNIRVNTTDFDGDGNTAEGAYYEIKQIDADLYAAIQAYARNVVRVPIAFNPDTHPYFFTDTNNNGVADSEEINSNNTYVNWTPRLLRAAYNHNYVSHDAGAFAHNSTYIIQVLYDSLSDIGGDTSRLSRP